MKQFSILSFLLITVFGFSQSQDREVNDFLDAWHRAAAIADFDGYFDRMHKNSIYIGTDASERWTKEEFKNFAKPFFDTTKRKSAWTFIAIERFINYSSDGNLAWFDEILDTGNNMKICRGSGILRFENGQWLIHHYVLSMTIPNELTRTIVPQKAPFEDKIIEQKKNNRLF